MAMREKRAVVAKASEPHDDGGASMVDRAYDQASRDRRAVIASRLASTRHRPTSAQDVATLIDLLHHGTSGAAAAEASAYVGDVTLLRPAKPSAFWVQASADLTDFWRARCIGALKVIDVAGCDHYTCLARPNAAQVWKILLDARAGSELP